MAEDPRPPPAAIRITRPYASEQEFLEQELDMVTRTSVTLLGAQARPQGAILRFELVLSNGQVLVRGEGRVVGFKPNVHQGLGGLTLRFTRLDSKSKGLVDRAAAMREHRRADGAPQSAEPPSVVAAPEPSSGPKLAPTDAGVESTRAVAPPAAAARVAPAPSGRDDLLARLRERAKTLDASAVRSILAQRRRA